MKFSMWMIVNRLQVLEPELSLHDGEKAEIKGVRFYAAETMHLFMLTGLMSYVNIQMNTSGCVIWNGKLHLA